MNRTEYVRMLRQEQKRLENKLEEIENALSAIELLYAFNGDHLPSSIRNSKEYVEYIELSEASESRLRFMEWLRKRADSLLPSKHREGDA